MAASPTPPVVFRTTRRIEFVDTDMAGIVHFSNFFRFMESAEVEFLRSRGLSVAMGWEGGKIGLPRRAASCEYLRTVSFEDLLEITVRVANVGRTSITYAFEFFKEGELVARGQVSCVCCRVLPEHRIEAMEIPASLRQKLLAPGS
jgi:YbgC/YbaW family acyl-CoA thioester hydrolase